MSYRHRSSTPMRYGSQRGLGMAAMLPGRRSTAALSVLGSDTASNAGGGHDRGRGARSASVAPSVMSTCTTSANLSRNHSFGRGSSRYARNRSTSMAPSASSGGLRLGRRNQRAESVMSEATTRQREEEEAAEPQVEETDDSWVTVVCEGKSVGRVVGIAAYQPSSGQVILTEVTDSQTYIKTVHTLSVRWPSVICTIGTTGFQTSSKGFNKDSSSTSKIEETLLMKALQSTFGNKYRENSDGTQGRYVDAAGVPMMPVARRFFNGEAGLEFISQLILQDEETASHLATMHGKYYALSAASALFKWLEISKNWIFPDKSVSIRYQPLEGTMLIDSESVKNLELVENIMDKRSKQSLYGLLNHCYTPMAQRLLRTNILSPLTDPSTIDTRLDVVAELIESEARFRALRKALQQLDRIDADKITGDILNLTSVTASEKIKMRKMSDPAKESEKKIQLVLQLRTFIKQLPNIKNILAEDGKPKSVMLATITKILGDDRLKAIEEEIAGTLNEQALASMTKTALSARTSRVFAIKAERKRLLDVARETYKENINDVDELLKELQTKYPELLDDVELAYNSASGFTFTIHEDILMEKTAGTLELPREFTKSGKKGRKIVFSCVDLLKRNQRIQQSLDEVFLLSSDVLDELLVAIRVHIAALYRCSEVMGMLDMLAAFANVAITSSSYVRPEFTDTLAIKDGRHPVLEKFRFGEGAFVPNDTYATEIHSFQLLTGPNMSGKTTFLKQIALLVVMSQIGCYVPAEYASFKIHGALLTRLSNDDSIEGNLSTFAREMKDMQMIISALSTCDNCLVLIDELGRGTSPQEGIGIAHAIAEEIIKSKASCFFATHFIDLASTLKPHTSVTALHLETEMTPADTSTKDFNLTFTHRVRDGHTTAKNYGLEVAKVAALPPRMLAWAKDATEKLGELEEARRENAKGTKAANRRKILDETAAALRQAYNSSRLSDRQLRRFVLDIIDQAVQGLTEGMEFPNEGEGNNQQMEEEDDNSDIDQRRREPMHDEEDDRQHDYPGIQRDEEEDCQSISSDTEHYNKYRAEAAQVMHSSSPPPSPQEQFSPLHLGNLELDNFSIEADTPDPTPAQALRNPSLDRVVEDSLPNSQITPVVSERSSSYIPKSDYHGDSIRDSPERPHKLSPFKEDEPPRAVRAESAFPSLPSNSNSFSLPSQTSPGRFPSKSASVEAMRPDSSLPSINTYPFENDDENKKQAHTSETEEELEEDSTFILPRAPVQQVDKATTNELSKASIESREKAADLLKAKNYQLSPKKQYIKVSQATNISSVEEGEGNESDADTLIDENEGGQASQETLQMDATQNTLVEQPAM